MDRYWFFTWRTYGTWLPGAPGFVGYYRAAHRERVIDNQFGQPTAVPIRALARYASERQTRPSVLLAPEHAPVVLVELLRTCTYRGWPPDALAVMPDHIHALVGVAGDPDPDGMVREFKSYASRALNRFGPRRDRWWVEQSSKRCVRGETARAAVVRYIRGQENSHLVWLSGEARRSSS